MIVPDEREIKDAETNALECAMRNELTRFQGECLQII